MSKTRKRFKAYTAVEESFKSEIKKAINIISVLKERAEVIKKIEENGKKDLEITEQIKGLKISLKLVEKEEIKKALEGIISKKEKELEKIDNESDELRELLSEYDEDLEEYATFIHHLYDTDCVHNFIDAKNMDFEQVSQNEFIVYLMVWSNFGDRSFPRFDKTNMHIIFHGVIDAMEKGWHPFINWIENN